MVLSVRNLFALFLLCLLSNTLRSQTNAAFFEYPVDTICNGVSTPVFVINQTTAGGSFSSTPAGLGLDPISGAIYPISSNIGTYQVTHTITSPTSASYTTTFTVDSTQYAFLAYPVSQVCKGDFNFLEVDTNFLFSVGTYSAIPSGLVIDPNTGTINISSSFAGTYTVFHVVGTFPCADTATFSLTIFDPMPYTLDYGVDTVCPSGVLCPISPTPGPGEFRPRAGLAYANDTLGCIDLVSTIPNRQYVICFVETSGCQRIFCDTIFLAEKDDASFLYPNSIACGNLDLFVPFTGPNTGTFTYTSTLGNSMLDLNAATGVLIPQNSDPDTYNIQHTTNGTCPDTADASLYITPAPVLPFPITNYGDTLLELNTSYFTTWYCDSTVVATGTTTIPVTMPGQYYAIATDVNGCEISSDTVNLTITSFQEGNFLHHLVQVFPNPSQGIFQVRSDRLSGGELQIQVFDLHGRQVQSGQIIPSQGGEIDLSRQPFGIYLLRISYRNYTHTLKLIKTTDQ